MYQPVIQSRSEFVRLRGLQHHARIWGSQPKPGAPLFVMLHGWLDHSATFQFLVDAMGGGREIIAPDWRGFGLSDRAPADSYWFPDYLADLDQLLDHYLASDPTRPLILIAHSMGGNLAMLYAGIRPERVQALVNIEGFGLRSPDPQSAPDRYLRWLNEVKIGGKIRSFTSLETLAAHVNTLAPRISSEQARWLAQEWASPNAEGEWVIKADPAHRLTNPVMYRGAEIAACWQRIAAPVLLIRALGSDHYQNLLEDESQLGLIRQLTVAELADAGHAVQQEQPAALAQRINGFLTDCGY